MEGTEYTTPELVLKRGQELIGIPLGTIDKTGRLSTGKGAIGSVIEESWYGYSVNSESEPDFPEAGIELKATPYIRNSKGVTAKERLVCNIINYMTEPLIDLEHSSFWHKCQKMLIMSYEHLYDRPKTEYKIDRAILFSFPEEDRPIIERDWKIIADKIRAGKAHELSEGDTMYLAACTKGATAASSFRQQPYSSEPAKQRAYSLKQTYMTQILREYVFGMKRDENIIKDWHELSAARSFEDLVTEELAPYFGRRCDELFTELGVPAVSKSKYELLMAAMLGIKGRVNDTYEFRRAGMTMKTIRVQMNGKIKESMSFPTIDFIKLKDEEWETSELYETLAPKRFMFAIFKEEYDGTYIFERIQFWNIPVEDLEHVHRVWEKTKETIIRGVKFRETPRGRENDLPGMTYDPVAHVRPHAKDSFDMIILPDGQWITKQSFWLNSTYIEKVIGVR